MKRLLLAGALAGALSLGTTAVYAQEHGQANRSYTDSNHVSHEWNNNEDAAWKRYRDEHHVKQEDFARASRKQQQAYWKWRHEHPDEHR